MGNSGRSFEDLSSGMNVGSKGQGHEVVGERRILSEIGLEAFHLYSVMCNFFLYFAYVLRLCGRLSLEMMKSLIQWRTFKASWYSDCGMISDALT